MIDMSMLQIGSDVVVGTAPVHPLGTRPTRDQERRAGHAAAQCAVEKMGLPPCMGKVAYERSGAPFLEKADFFHLSISHAGARAVAVLSRSPVGIDIEYVRERSPHMLSYISATAERALLPAMPEKTTLTSLWTIKEAVMKGARKGLSWSPRQVRVVRMLYAGSVIHSRVVDPNNHVWDVRTVIQEDGYVDSLATL